MATDRRSASRVLLRRGPRARWESAGRHRPLHPPEPAEIRESVRPLLFERLGAGDRCGVSGQARRQDQVPEEQRRRRCGPHVFERTVAGQQRSVHVQVAPGTNGHLKTDVTRCMGFTASRGDYWWGLRMRGVERWCAVVGSMTEQGLVRRRKTGLRQARKLHGAASGEMFAFLCRKIRLPTVDHWETASDNVGSTAVRVEEAALPTRRLLNLKQPPRDFVHSVVILSMEFSRCSGTA